MDVIASVHGFFLGSESGGRCEAPLTKEIQRITGCVAATGLTELVARSRFVRKYSTLAEAARALAELKARP